MNHSLTYEIQFRLRPTNKCKGRNHRNIKNQKGNLATWRITKSRTIMATPILFDKFLLFYLYYEVRNFNSVMELFNNVCFLFCEQFKIGIKMKDKRYYFNIYFEITNF